MKKLNKNTIVPNNSVQAYACNCKRTVLTANYDCRDYGGAFKNSNMIRVNEAVNSGNMNANYR